MRVKVFLLLGIVSVAGTGCKIKPEIAFDKPYEVCVTKKVTFSPLPSGAQVDKVVVDAIYGGGSTDAPFVKLSGADPNVGQVVKVLLFDSHNIIPGGLVVVKSVEDVEMMRF